MRRRRTLLHEGLAQGSSAVCAMTPPTLERSSLLALAMRDWCP